MELEWIPIEDELPYKDVEVLATHIDEKWVVIAIIKRTNWYNSWDVINNQKVAIYPTHWMPLPDPPQK
jgi:hypothetical protein